MKQWSKKKLAMLAALAVAAVVAVAAGWYAYAQATAHTTTQDTLPDADTAVQADAGTDVQADADLSAVQVRITAQPLALVLNGEATANLGAGVEETGLPEGGQILLFYTASNDSITVDAAGNVTALAQSAVMPFVTIVAKYDADADGTPDSTVTLATQKVSVSVSVVVEGIALSQEAEAIEIYPYTGAASDTLALSVSALPEGASTSYTYLSSDSEVASVSADGVVTGISEGKVIVAVTSAEGFIDSCKITVTRAASDISAQEEAEAAAAAAKAAAEAAAAQAAAEAAAAEAAAAEAAAAEAAAAQAATESGMISDWVSVRAAAAASSLPTYGNVDASYLTQEEKSQAFSNQSVNVLTDEWKAYAAAMAAAEQARLDALLGDEAANVLYYIGGEGDNANYMYGSGG